MKTAEDKKRFSEAEKHLHPYFEETGYDLNAVQLKWVLLAMESYAKQQIIDAICDYALDKSDKAHINTVEDWVEDWINSNKPQ